MGTDTIELTKLNLGCGHKLFREEGVNWINVDLPGNWSGHKPDVEADVRKLPFEDDYADEVYAIHILEHFYPWEMTSIVTEWKRVLKPDGLFVIEVPDLEKVAKFILDDMHSPTHNLSFTYWALYGDPRHQERDMMHKWGFTYSMLRDFLSVVGFRDIKRKEPIFHFKERDMRVECIK